MRNKSDNLDQGIHLSSHLAHKYPSTTQAYMEMPDKYCREQINKGLKNQIARAFEHQKKTELEGGLQTPQKENGNE